MLVVVTFLGPGCIDDAKITNTTFFMPPRQRWPWQEALCFVVVRSILVNAISPNLEEMSTQG